MKPWDKIPSDLNFPAGVTHVLLIDTDKYSGNFEREMSAFAIGAYDEDRYHGGVQSAEFEEAAEEDPRLQRLLEKVTSISHGEYGDVTNTIWPTPECLNDGYGNHLTLAEFEAKHPGKQGCCAYQTVAVFLDEPLTEEELEIVRTRATEYGKNRIDFGDRADPVQVTGVRQITVEVERTVKTTVRG